MKVREVLEAHPRHDVAHGELVARGQHHRRLLEAHLRAVARGRQPVTRRELPRERVLVHADDLREVAHVLLARKVVMNGETGALEGVARRHVGVGLHEPLQLRLSVGGRGLAAIECLRRHLGQIEQMRVTPESLGGEHEAFVRRGPPHQLVDAQHEANLASGPVAGRVLRGVTLAHVEDGDVTTCIMHVTAVAGLEATTATQRDADLEPDGLAAHHR